jgi:hypothetical protein
MSLSGSVSEGNAIWSVTADTHQAEGGFVSQIKVAARNLHGDFAHQFKDSQIFATERDAVLHGLSEGMAWIELEISGTIRL